jgi:hypothetical protein
MNLFDRLLKKFHKIIIFIRASEILKKVDLSGTLARWKVYLEKRV